MSKTKITWTNAVWNTISGCHKVSAGCENCYAEKLHYRLQAMGQTKYSNNFNDITIHSNELSKPFEWRKPRMIFVNSMSDTFHSLVPYIFLDRIFETILNTPQHTYQMLTKRPNNALTYFESIMPIDKNIPNLWLGASIENNKVLRRIEILKKIPVTVRFLSIEPLLEQITLPNLDGIHWVIIGCESGIGRRQCKIEWIENIVEQCRQQNVPVFVKQINLDGNVLKDIEQFPVHLQIQEYPTNK